VCCMLQEHYLEIERQKQQAERVRQDQAHAQDKEREQARLQALAQHQQSLCHAATLRQLNMQLEVSLSPTSLWTRKALEAVDICLLLTLVPPHSLVPAQSELLPCFGAALLLLFAPVLLVPYLTCPSPSLVSLLSCSLASLPYCQEEKRRLGELHRVQQLLRSALRSWSTAIHSLSRFLCAWQRQVCGRVLVLCCFDGMRCVALCLFAAMRVHDDIDSISCWTRVALSTIMYHVSCIMCHVSCI
jgi:hypothetical protein